MTFSASQMLPRFLGRPSRPFLEKTEAPMKLTETSIKRLSLTDGKTDEIFFDDDLTNFGLRLREGGSRKWVFHYRQGGIQRRLQ